MLISERSYPHPVLGNGDDVRSELEAILSPSFYGENYELGVEISSSNTTISNLIKKKEACFVLHIECSNTAYRKANQFYATKRKLQIPTEDIFGTVQVVLAIVAKKDNSRYKLKEAHPDFGERSFRISEGDILGITPTQFFDADAFQDTAVKSWMRIDPDTSGSDEMYLNYHNELLIVYLPKKDYSALQTIRQLDYLTEIHFSTVTLPALTSAVEYLKNQDDSDRDQYRWQRGLQRRLEEVNLTLDRTIDSLRAAQAVLESPLTRSFTATMRMDENLNSDLE